MKISPVSAGSIRWTIMIRWTIIIKMQTQQERTALRWLSKVMLVRLMMTRIRRLMMTREKRLTMLLQNLMRQCRS